jgi:uncharacterized tellurite resistance protein B-like protein
MVTSILQKLGLIPPEKPDELEPDTPAIRLITERLEGLEPERAVFVAAFAMVLARAARADLEVSDDERWIIKQILEEHADLEADQIELLLEMVVHRFRLFGAADDYLATREFKRIASDRHRECILRCLFAVCAADDSISLVEEEEVRQIASELGATHKEYVTARAEFREKREVLRGLKQRRKK